MRVSDFRVCVDRSRQSATHLWTPPAHRKCPDCSSRPLIGHWELNRQIPKAAVCRISSIIERWPLLHRSPFYGSSEGVTRKTTGPERVAYGSHAVMASVMATAANFSQGLSCTVS